MFFHGVFFFCDVCFWFSFFLVSISCSFVLPRCLFIARTACLELVFTSPKRPPSRTFGENTVRQRDEMEQNG